MKKMIALLLMLMLLLAGCGGGPVLEIMKVSPEGISYVLNNYGAAPITFGAAQGLEVLRQAPTMKDWNDDLLAQHQQDLQQRGLSVRGRVFPEF